MGIILLGVMVMVMVVPKVEVGAMGDDGLILRTKRVIIRIIASEVFSGQEAAAIVSGQIFFYVVP